MAELNGGQVAAVLAADAELDVRAGALAFCNSEADQAAYAAAAGTLTGFTRNAAVRLGQFGIRVNSIAPGIIDTDMTSVVHEKYERMIEGGLLPVQRFGKPADVARMVLACCSGLLDYSAGQVLDADGGFALRRL